MLCHRDRPAQEVDPPDFEPGGLTPSQNRGPLPRVGLRPTISSRSAKEKTARRHEKVRNTLLGACVRRRQPVDQTLHIPTGDRPHLPGPELRAKVTVEDALIPLQ
jgi:hypothetical protein